ncbi:heme-binding protein [soil metagenome]
MRVRHALELSECDVAVVAGLAEAAREGWAVTIAMVDDSGTPIRLSRMDEASAASVSTAIEKARSAALTGVETKLMEAMIKDRPAVATMGRVAVEGGVPILHKGQRVGGIGVSGVQSHQDAQVAKATRAALALLL